MSIAQSLSRNLRAVGSLQKEERGLAFRVGLTACVLPILARILSLPRLLTFLDTQPIREDDRDPARILSLVERVLARNIGPLQPGCYRRSLLGFRELRRSGFPARVFFGIRENGDALDGHAWIEVEGLPLGETADPREAFRMVYTYPPESNQRVFSS